MTETTSPKLLTGLLAPELTVQTLEGKEWRLADQKPEHYTLIVFYRGLHCPFCKAQLQELDQKLSEFQKLGVEVIAISGDVQERAAQAKADWGIENLTIGINLPTAAMRTWGLYISKSGYENEPAFFNEPAMFLVQTNGIIRFTILSSIPFGRPSLTELLGGIDYITKNNYPIRGTELPV